MLKKIAHRHKLHYSSNGRINDKTDKRSKNDVWDMKAEKRQKHGSRSSTTTIDNKSKGRNQGDKRPKDSKVNYIKSMKVKKK